jgi:hypothetical protein
MKLLLPLAIFASLTLAACGSPCQGDRANVHAPAHANAASQAEKAFDKENPADPAALQAAPK